MALMFLCPGAPEGLLTVVWVLKRLRRRGLVSSDKHDWTLKAADNLPTGNLPVVYRVFVGITNARPFLQMNFG